MAVQYSFKVRWGDTDAATIVFFPNFYRWMDEATHEFFTSIGYPMVTLMAERKVGVPLLESKCTFKQPLMFEDEVVLITEVIELHNKVFKLSHEFYRDGVLVAEGYTLRAWTSFADKPRAITISDDVREQLQAHSKEASC